VKADDHLSNAVINSVLQGTQGLFCNTLIAHSWVCTHYAASFCCAHSRQVLQFHSQWHRL